MEDVSLSANDRIITFNCYRVYTHHLIIGNSLYKPFFITDFSRNIKSSSKNSIFAISLTCFAIWKHWINNHTECRCGRDYGRLILVLISAITRAIFGWWFLPLIWIRYSLYILIPSVWLCQLVLCFFKHLLESYIFASDRDGWNLMR